MGVWSRLSAPPYAASEVRGGRSGMRRASAMGVARWEMRAGAVELSVWGAGG